MPTVVLKLFAGWPGGRKKWRLYASRLVSIKMCTYTFLNLLEEKINCMLFSKEHV